MVNLYQLLGITPAAAADEIRQALATAAQQQALPPPALQKCRDILLDADKRRQYDAQLFAAHPEILEAATTSAPLQEKTGKPILNSNLYEALGIKPNAPEPDVRAAIDRAAKLGADKDLLGQARFHLLHKARRTKYNSKIGIKDNTKLYWGAGAVLGLIVCVFAWQYVKHWAENGKAQSLANEAALLFKDPQSVQFEGLKLAWIENKWLYLCGAVNAKNGFGAYTGFSPFAYDSTLKSLIFPDSAYINIPSGNPDNIKVVGGEEAIRLICRQD